MSTIHQAIQRQRELEQLARAALAEHFAGNDSVGEQDIETLIPVVVVCLQVIDDGANPNRAVSAACVAHKVHLDSQRGAA